MNSLVVRAGYADTQVMAFRPDGRVLATCGDSKGDIRFWRVRDGALLGVFQGHPGLRNFGLSQNRLITCGESHLRLWRTTLMDDQGFEFPQLAEFSCSGERFKISSRHFLFHLPDQKVAFSSLQDGSTLNVFPEARWFHCGGRGRRVLTGGEKSSLHSGVSGRLVAELESGCHQCAYSPEERWIAMAGLADPRVYLTDPDSQKTWPLEGHRGRVLALEFSPDGLWLASAAEDRSLLVLGLEDWQLVRFDTEVGPAVLMRWLSGHRVAVADSSGTVQIFQISRSGSRAQAAQSVVSDAAVSGGRWCGGPDGLAAFSSPGQRVRLLNLSDPVLLSQLAPPLRPQSHHSIGLAAPTILIGKEAWDLWAGQQLPECDYGLVSQHVIWRKGALMGLLEGPSWPTPEGTDRLLAICPQGQRFAFYQPENRLLEVMVREGSHLTVWRSRISDHPGRPEFSPDGELLALYYRDGPPKIWMLELDQCQEIPDLPHFLREGGWVHRNGQDLEFWNSSGLRIRTRPMSNIKGLQTNQSRRVVVQNDQGVQVLDPHLEPMQGSLNIPALDSMTVSPDGRWLVVRQSCPEGPKYSRLSVWALPAGPRLDEARLFQGQEFDVQFNSQWVVVAGNHQCGCWRLPEGNFQWLDFPESHPGRCLPLEAGVLQVTPDGSCHLYQGSPLQRMASLYTASHGNWIVITREGRWDASPDLLNRVARVQQPELTPVDPLQRYADLWRHLMTRAPATIDPAASPNPKS